MPRCRGDAAVRDGVADVRATGPEHQPEKQRMDPSRLLYSPNGVAAVGDADAHAVAAAAGELHGPEGASISARRQRRASSPAYRMVDWVVVADRGVDSLVESQLSAVLSW